MRDFVLMTDSCCDMAPQMAEELGLIVLPLSLELGGATYHNYLDGRGNRFFRFLQPHPLRRDRYHLCHQRGYV